MRLIAAVLALALAAGAGGAEPGAPLAALALPDGAARTATVTDAPAPHAVAIGPATATTPAPTATLDGPRTRIAWRTEPYPGAGLALSTALRAGLLADGFEIVFVCRTSACGGFDFRHARAMLPMPEMIVDLSGYTYLAARRGPEDAPDALAAVMISEGPAGAFAQLTLVTAAPAAPPDTAPTGTGPDAAAPTTGATAANDADATNDPFDARGRFVLADIAFASGQARLSDTATESLSRLAAWLEADPRRRVALVGHTDATGPADVNRRLSRARAAAVAAALSDRFGIAPDRIEVDGAGPFAPRAGNATDAGRAANRRVEAVKLPPAP